MVHQFKNNGYNIILDVNSGAVHVVDELVYDIVSIFIGKTKESNRPDISLGAATGTQSLPECGTDGAKGGLFSSISREAVKEVLSDRYPLEDIGEAYDEVCQLIEKGQLFTKDTYMPYLKSFANRPVVVKALCLHIAHDCNLACEYCFAGKGEYHGDRELMSLETGKKALDFLVRESGSRKHLEVDFFGGEPTMNFEVVRGIVAYGRELEKTTDKIFRFTLTTNGLLLKEDMFDYINREMSNVVLSIDGRKDINDRMRPLRSGKGSLYDIILPKYKALAKSRKEQNYYVRGTFTRNNLDFAQDVLHLADQGFTQISVEPVVAQPEEPYAIRSEDLEVILEQYDHLAAEMVKRKKEGRGFNFFHFMIDLEGGPCVAKRLQGCGSGCEYLSVIPNGDLYPCHQFTGIDGMKMGDVDTGVTNTELRSKFHESNVYTKPECQECFAKFFCSGGCAANSYNFTGDINGNYEVGCAMQRKRVECAIMLKAAGV